MSQRPMLDLLQADHWGAFQPDFDALHQWRFYPLLTEYLRTLNHKALFVSRIHGLGHIERTLLQGGFCAMAEDLDEMDTRLLLECCSYHDVGRIDDSADPLHGARALPKLEGLTGRKGEPLKLLRAAVDAHSRRDADLIPTLEAHAPEDFPRALLLARLLKDSDGLDRVRLGDLNPDYLRRPASKTRVALATEVFLRYQTRIGEAPKPFFSQEEIARYRALAAKTR